MSCRHHRSLGAALVLTLLALPLTGCSGTGPGAHPAAGSAPSSTTTSSTQTATQTPVQTPAPTATPTSTPIPTGAPTPTLPVVPRAGSEPAVRFPKAPAALGRGAHPMVRDIPDSQWSQMIGYSWTSGCPVGRSSLRLLEVNYWGFDGLRHRGRLVIRSTIAARAASAFTALYRMKFRIRQMQPMDSTWGHNPKGPGANDYVAMRADNTSGFNCRYVGGEESHKVWSNHAYGLAIDVNDLENPYVAADGTVYPTAYFLHRRGGAGTFGSADSEAVRAFTRLGFQWGGRWSDPDLQHFELT